MKITNKVLIAFIISTSLQAQSPCDKALSACQDLVNAQETQILHLKQDVKDLQENVVDEESSKPTLPWYAYILLGAAGAVVAGRVFR